MRTAFEDRSVNLAVAELQRLALRAATIGFSISLGIVILYSATQRFAASKTGMHSSLDAICAAVAQCHSYAGGANVPRRNCIVSTIGVSQCGVLCAGNNVARNRHP